MTRRGVAVLLLGTAGVLPTGAVFAQAYQCHVPARVAVPTVVPDGPQRVLPVSGYTLALSWSPAFCRLREASQAHTDQCSGRRGRFGLTVHGLWPNSGEGWPQWCGSRRQPSSADIAANLCMAPSARLLARQWAKHGSCMARRPATYFRVTRILWNSLRLPDLDRMSREPGLTAGGVRAQFAVANPGWSPRGVGLVLDDGWLQEIRLCYDRRFRPAACEGRRRGPRDNAPVAIWRGL